MVRQIDNIHVNIYRHGEDGSCFYVGESDREVGSADNFAARLTQKAENAAYTLVVYEVSDWNSQFSPWSARSAFGEEMFAGRGADTLAWLTDKCIPRLREEKSRCKKIVLQWNKGGYFADAEARLAKGILWILQSHQCRGETGK